MQMQTKALVGRRVKAADLVKAITDPAEMKLQRPEAPKPAVAIETMTMVGKDKLRAGDAAIYELLLAWSREQTDEGGEHVIPASHVRSYLAQGDKGDGHAHNDRLVEALDRLSTTHVRYDVRDEAFRERGTVPLVTAKLRERLSDGASTVHYAFDPAVRRLMFSDRSVGWLELGVYPYFRNKYSPRLYQRMALKAGYSEDCQKDWIVAPEELARELGYGWQGDFRYHDFRKNALDPALAEIKKHSGKVHFFAHDPVTESSGRGRPKVIQLRFTITRGMDPHVMSTKAGLLTMEESVMLKRPDHVHDERLLPSVGAFARVYKRETLSASHVTGDLPRPVDLLQAWWAALDEAVDGYDYKSGHPAPVRGIDVFDEKLWSLIENFGADDAFAKWAEATRETGRFLKRLEAYAPAAAERDRGPSDPVERRQWYINRSVKEALCRVNNLVEIERGVFLPRRWEEDLVWLYCDHEIEPWYIIADDMGADFRILSKALELMQVHVDKSGDTKSRVMNKQRRITLRNLLRALEVRNFARMSKIAIAVVARYKEAELKKVR
ncbi:replication initiation protein [Mesorhizobium sp. B2-3-3]|nr:replication initiation protein [Mesorhizobium sp. B2-3-3]